MSNENPDIRYDFLYWQCRIRQQSVRVGDGRPTQGMCPEVITDGVSLGQIITVITKESPEEITAQFKHTVKKTLDPIERWESAINLFAETYYQGPNDFSDELSALFGPASETCNKLIESGQCVLKFEQNNQQFSVPCKIINLAPDHVRYQATYWHNSLFNPSMPGDIKILSFVPDWSSAKSEKVSS